MFNPYQDQISALEEKIAENQQFLADPELKNLVEAEISELTEQKKQLEAAALQYEAASSGDEVTDTTAEKVNCSIEFRSGTGGDEAKIWANDLLRMYTRFAEKIGLKIEYIDEMVVKIKGKTTDLPELHSDDKPYTTAYEIFQFESGVHRVQRVPVTEAQGRIHTSTATVAVLPEVSKKEIVVRDEDLDWQFMRAGGAGGQHVNKTSSAVRLTHLPSGIVTTARQERHQLQNREIALELLRAQLWEIEEEKRLKTLGDARSLIGQARRSEKIRTYNFAQNRVTDHRTKQSWYNLMEILEGELETLLIDVHTALNANDEESADTKV